MPAAVRLYTIFFSLLLTSALSAHEETITISELMYHPPTPGETLEFIEVTNTGTAWVDLSGWQFVEGITFTFPTGVFLAPGQFLVVARDRDALSAAGGANVFGNYEGSLDNGGEFIQLVDANAHRIVRFRYDDDGDWPDDADGAGSSLERISMLHDPVWGATFRASLVLGGTPGRENATNGQAPDPGMPCRLNELSVTETEAVLELYNPTNEAASLAGYAVVPDGRLQLAIPLGDRVVPANEFVLTAIDLGALSGNVVRFFLIEADTGQLVDVLEVGTTTAPTTYARYPDGTGRVWTVPAATLGAPNDPPPNRPVVLSEIYYHPPDENSRREWVEITNISDTWLDLGGWRLSRAITFAFPFGTSVRPRGSIIVAADPELFLAGYGSAGDGTGALGPFTGALRDSRDTLRLRDADDNIVDEVAYADDGPWPREADGLGKSLVRLSPDLPGSAPGAWAASFDDGGSPFVAAFSADEDTDPVVYAVKNTPGTPAPGEPISVSGLVAGTRPLLAVTVSWQRDGADTFISIPAILGDVIPHKGQHFSASLPPQAIPGTLAFYVTVVQQGGRTTSYPTASEALFEIDDEPDSDVLETFRLVMRSADWDELLRRSRYSDVPLPCTLVYRSVPYYESEMRYRGNSARSQDPKSYRVDVDDFHGAPLCTTLVLNGYHHEDQRLGLDLLSRSGIVTPRSRVVEVVTPGGHIPEYIQVDMINGDFIRWAFPSTEEDGNLYRGDGNATLAYRGDDPDSYRGSYVKKTNEELDDYSDIIELCRTLSDQEEFDLHVEEVIEVSEWAHWYGIMAILNNEENGIANRTGDDYFIYNNPATGRFWLLPWDLDTILDTPTERLFRPELDAIERLLRWPPAARQYTATLLTELASHARPEVVIERAAALAAFSESEELEKLTTGITERAAYITAQIPRRIEAGTMGGSSNGVFVSGNGMWRYFKGRRDPSRNTIWTRLGYNDQTWSVGQAGFGYGDEDDNTLLDDMENRYSSLYIRTTFTVPDADQVGPLTLRVLTDDGFAAYINGVEVGRFNAGSPGETLHHDDLAEFGIEPTVRTFEFADPSSILRSGQNVLAIIGLNNAPGSSDFSLDADLVSPSVGGGGVGWGTRLQTDEENSLVSGVAIPEVTTRVHVNGTPVSYDPTRFTWQAPVAPAIGRNEYLVELFDETDTLRASEEILVWRADARMIDGIIPADAVWTEADGPYVITEDTTVPSTVTLTLEPGTTVFVEAGRRLTVAGRLSLNGTSDAPCHITPTARGGRWAGIRFEGNGDHSLRHVRLRGGEAGQPFLDVRGGTLTLTSSAIEDVDDWALRIAGATAVISDTVMRRVEGGIEAQNATVTLTAVHCAELGEQPALAQTSGVTSVTVCRFENGTDGLRLYGNAALQGLICRGFTGAAVTIGRTGVTGTNLLLAGNGTGLIAGPDVSTRFNHVTIADADIAIGAASFADVWLVDTIVWQNRTMVAADPNGAVHFLSSNVEDPRPDGGNQNDDPQFRGGIPEPYCLGPDSPSIGAAAGGGDQGAFAAGLALPVITEITPAQGNVHGGTPVTVTGTGFTPLSVVLVDGSPLANLEFVSGETMRGDIPSRGSPAAVPVAVVSELGRTVTPAAFTYANTGRRGDANGSGVLDLSDVIFTLSFLYGGGSQPVCPGALDVNSDDTVDVADTITLLSFLFAGGPSPNPPEADC